MNDLSNEHPYNMVIENIHFELRRSMLKGWRIWDKNQTSSHFIY